MSTQHIIKKKSIIRHNVIAFKIPQLITCTTTKLQLLHKHRCYGYCFKEVSDAEKGVGVASDVSSSSSLKSFSYLSSLKLLQFINCPSSIPENESHLVEISPDGVKRPFNLPDLSDLALTPIALKLVYVWLLTRANPNEIQQLLESIMRGTEARIPKVREEFQMNNGSHEMLMRSYCNDFKLVHLNSEFTSSVSVEATISHLSKDAGDGRDIKLRMIAEGKHIECRPSKRVKISNPGPQINVVIWNCRGLARPAFATMLQHSIDCHNPDVFILSETRVSSFIADIVLGGYECNISGAMPEGLAGGMLVVGMSKAVRIHTHAESRNHWSGLIQLK